MEHVTVAWWPASHWLYKETIPEETTCPLPFSSSAPPSPIQPTRGIRRLVFARACAGCREIVRGDQSVALLEPHRALAAPCNVSIPGSVSAPSCDGGPAS